MSADDFIPVNTPLIGAEERDALLACIESGWISSEGPQVAKFEAAFSEKVSRKFGVAVANGSAALDISVAALGLGPGDEVILPSFTIISCITAVIRSGATPVLVDSCKDTWNMNVEEVRKKITKQTKAIMVVHLYGLPVDMADIMSLAEEHGLYIIEDAAEAHGQTYNGSACGSFGTLSTFSFYPNKHITTGEGGMVVCDDEGLAERLKGLRNLCFQANRRFVHEELGWNYRMTCLQAAIGLTQLQKLDEFVMRKRNMGRVYTELLKHVPGLTLPVPNTSYAENIYWVYGLVLKDELQFDASLVMHRLKESNIGTRPFFWPMHEQPVFVKQGMFNRESYPVSERIARRGFYLPSGLGITVKEQHKVVDVLVRVLEDLGSC